jgi:hypothetical protein
MTFGVNSRTAGGESSVIGPHNVRQGQHTRLFEGLALDRDKLRCQGELSPVRGGNDGGSMAGIS